VAQVVEKSRQARAGKSGLAHPSSYAGERGLGELGKKPAVSRGEMVSDIGEAESLGNWAPLCKVRWNAT
jgi:hypothetical protein